MHPIPPPAGHRNPLDAHTHTITPGGSKLGHYERIFKRDVLDEMNWGWDTIRAAGSLGFADRVLMRPEPNPHEPDDRIIRTIIAELKSFQGPRLSLTAGAHHAWGQVLDLKEFAERGYEAYIFGRPKSLSRLRGKPEVEKWFAWNVVDIEDSSPLHIDDATPLKGVLAPEVIA